ncbi:MAG: CoA transferase [Gammaproteobacteria bacterium]|nr:CoA transferase [Gammaproteobacteria bacterium]
METSLDETAVWTPATDDAVTAVDHAPVRRRTRHELISATANRYPCGDGRWLVINMPQPSAWPKFCKAIGREEWLEDERFADLRGRFHNMREIVDGIDAALAAKGRDEWGAIFDEAGIIWGPVLALHEVADDPQAEAIGLFPEIEHPEHRARSDGQCPVPLRAPPTSAPADRPRASASTARRSCAGRPWTTAEIEALRADGTLSGS